MTVPLCGERGRAEPPPLPTAGLGTGRKGGPQAAACGPQALVGLGLGLLAAADSLPITRARRAAHSQQKRPGREPAADAHTGPAFFGLLYVPPSWVGVRCPHQLAALPFLMQKLVFCNPYSSGGRVGPGWPENVASCWPPSAPRIRIKINQVRLMRFA